MTRPPLDRDVTPNPYDDVPDALARSLEEYVLSAPYDDIIEDPSRTDALDLLFEQLGRVYDEPQLRSRWKAQHRRVSFRVGMTEEGKLRVIRSSDGHGGKIAVVPADIVDALIVAILGNSRQSRHETFMATRHLIGDWFDLAVDDEKLLGHLIRAHATRVELPTLDSAALWVAHSKLHEIARSGSKGEWATLKAAHAVG